MLVNKKDVDILSTINDNHHPVDFVFDNSLDFAFAVGFTAYDGNKEPILEPEYGELVFKHLKWGHTDTINTERVAFPSHSCTPEELGLEGDPSKSLFLPIRADSVEEVKQFQKKLLCADRENYYLQGNYNTYKGTQFNIQFVKCTRETRPDLQCKSDEEITAFIRNKYLLVLFN